MLLNLMFVLVVILLRVEPSVHLVEVFEMMRQQRISSYKGLLFWALLLARIVNIELNNLRSQCKDVRKWPFPLAIIG